MTESKRKSEAELAKDLESDLPVIFRGLLDLIANIFRCLPSSEVTRPERMLDFVHWLAAMEKAHNAPAGAFQHVYSDTLHQSQLDSLLENLLAAAVIEFSESKLTNGKWVSSPSQLLSALEMIVEDGTKRSAEWPKNPIALSKRLNSLKASLLTQGICVESGRGKKRTITITTK